MFGCTVCFKFMKLKILMMLCEHLITVHGDSHHTCTHTHTRSIHYTYWMRVTTL